MNDAELVVPFGTPHVGKDAWRLDEAAERRHDPEWLRHQWRQESAQYVRIDAGRVGLRRNGADIEVDWRPAADLELSSDSGLPISDWALVGVAADGSARFSVRDALAPDEGLALRELSLTTGYGSDSQVASLIAAVGVMNWHESHQWCPECGGATVPREAGWVRECENDGRTHFPRLDPAVIMLVSDGADRALLGSQSRWPRGWFSTLAGFVEPGESLEAAVRREIVEEAGVVVDRVSYRASQPWPFPSSIMVGFRAMAAGSPDARPDGAELDDARWFTRDQLAQACSAGDVRLPPRVSISRLLIEDWYGGELPSDWSRS